jgi:hypothetical protein
MLKAILATTILAAAPLGAAGAATIVLLPEPGSMSAPTIIVDPRAARNDPVLVCGSMAQLTAGACTLRSQTAPRRN